MRAHYTLTLSASQIRPKAICRFMILVIYSPTSVALNDRLRRSGGSTASPLQAYPTDPRRCSPEGLSERGTHCHSHAFSPRQTIPVWRPTHPSHPRRTTQPWQSGFGCSPGRATSLGCWPLDVQRCGLAVQSRVLRGRPNSSVCPGLPGNDQDFSFILKRRKAPNGQCYL